MGNFQAISNSDDKPIKFDGQTISEGTDSPTVENYYKSILKAALVNFKLSTEFPAKPSPKEKLKNDFETEVKPVWGEAYIFDPIGYILLDNHITKDIGALLDRIADEENKYHWQWLEGGKPVKDTSVDVLNKLRIVNVRLLNKIFFDSAAQKLWLEQEKPIQDASLTTPTIVISPSPFFFSGNNFYYGVYINNGARLLFLDTSQKTQSYKYSMIGKEFKCVRTYIYRNNILQDIANVDYFFENTPDCRYIDKLMKQTRKKNLIWNNTTRNVYPFQVTQVAELKLKQIIKEKKFSPSLFDEIQATAEADACLIPLKHHCFYHDNKGTLMGHISGVLIGEGGRGGSGYPMRADKVNEVEYRWRIDLPVGDPNIPLAKLWSYLFELDSLHLASAAPIIKKSRETADGFYPTNWPYNKETPDKATPGFTTAADSMASWIQYYKTFTDKAVRRNLPAEKPFPPRVTNPAISGYDYKFDKKDTETSVKLDNASYRVWKKSKSGGDSPLILGTNENERQDAGKVMAEALGDFSVYEGMIKSDVTPKITYSKLSATAFAKYVLSKDEKAQAQWLKDNFLPNGTKVYYSSLKTDQEWCHLFGHGDGGPEELGNFVCGSEHCNTEQLAIETGQRRVSQNETFKNEAKNIKARITAYLIPNAGTWVSGEFTQKDLDKDLLDKITTDAVKNKQADFFEKTGEKFKLKNDNDLRAAHKALSEAISDPKNSANKIELLQFRHNLERHFFMYLPIARWMRYKLYYNNTKIFDHIYDAQSESINLHECQILDYTVERELYRAMGKWDKYNDKIKERVKNLVATEEQAKIIEGVLVLNQNLFEIFNILRNMSTMVYDLKSKLPESGAISESVKKEISGICKTMQENLEKAKTDIDKKNGDLQTLAKLFNELDPKQKIQHRMNDVFADIGLPANVTYLTNMYSDLKSQTDQMDEAIKNFTLESINTCGNKILSVISEKKRENAALPDEFTRPLKREKSMIDNQTNL